MNNNEGTRNFETVQKNPESPKGNKNKPDAKKIITISIFAIAIAVILLFSAVIVVSIVDSLTEDEDTGVPVEIKFKTVKVSDSDLYNGNLLVIKDKSDLDNSFDADVVDIDDYNNGKSPYEIGTKYPCDLLSEETVEHLNTLAKDLNTAKDAKLIIAFAYDVEKATGADFEHALGTVLDIKQVLDSGDIGLLESDVLSWIKTNAAKYGFIISTPEGHDETTQLRYVGVAHATYMENRKCGISEYVSAIKEYYSKNEMLEIKGADGKQYAVYYVKENSEIEVPSNYNYEISGDNKGGYIITVDLSKSAE